jgi:MFS family permease
MGKFVHKAIKTPLRHRIKTESITWSCLSLVSALLEGGVLGIIVKNGFSEHVHLSLLNFAVAIVTGAPYFSNLLSVFWIKLSRGRDKAILITYLGFIFCFCAFLMSFVPFSAIGLLFFILLLIIARISWSGILTIRSTIWRVNYPRYIRGKVTAILATFAFIIMSLTAILIGSLLDWNFDLFRWIFMSLSILSLYGPYRYRQLNIRHQQKNLLNEEQSLEKSSFLSLLLLLKNNLHFRHYMIAMFILGSGNLMFMAPMIVYLNEHTSLLKLSQMLISTAIPLALIPLAVNRWAQLLDKHHILYFRSIHSWFFVASITCFLLAQVLTMTWFYFVGSFIYGIALAGGVIGWNLGHNDFVKKGNPIDYMVIHVTLTGVRGLFMPLIGIGLYQWLELRALSSGQWALLLPLTLSTIGSLYFTSLYRKQ